MKNTGTRYSARFNRVENPGPAFTSLSFITVTFLPALALFAAAALWAAPAHAQTVTEKKELRFGTVAGSGDSTGSVTLSTSGAVTTTGSAVNMGGQYRNAEYEVRGPKNTNVILTLPSTATVSAGGPTATLQSFVADPAAGVLQSLGNNGRLTYTVGATLDLSAGQAAGDYAGTFSVFVDPG